MSREGESPASLPRSALAAALTFWGAIFGLALLGPSRDSLGFALVGYSAAFLALIHLWFHHRKVLDDPRVLLGGALLLRLTLFPSLPDLSDDLYRYVWDGWLSYSGMNPFRFVPADPALAEFQSSWLFNRLNSPGYHSIYPPLSQLVFLLGGAVEARIGWPASAYAVKGGFLLLELSGVCLLHLALRAQGKPSGALALYALNPLPIVVIAGSGHTEGGLVLGLGLLAFGVASGAHRRAWMGLVLAGASKGIPLLLAPLLVRHQLGKIGLLGTIRATVPGMILGVALLLPFDPAEMLLAARRSADLYVRLFEFNAGLYFALRSVGGRPVPTGDGSSDRPSAGRSWR
jgi:alpha-1,6-mannosyltransferase